MEDQRAVGARQARDLVRVAFGPSLVALVIIAAVTLLQLRHRQQRHDRRPRCHRQHVAGRASGADRRSPAIELGVMPLLPVLLMVWGTARTTAQATAPQTSWFVIRWIVASALGGPLLIAAIALAVIHDASSVITELQTPNALRAFARCAGGARRRCADRCGLARGAPRGQVAAAARVAGRRRPRGRRRACSRCSVCPVWSTAASLVVHWGTMHDLYAITDSMFGQLSLTVLSVLYAPERHRRHRGGRRRLQRAHRARDVQFVHGVRRRHPGAADPGGGADTAARARCGWRC